MASAGILRKGAVPRRAQRRRSPMGSALRICFPFSGDSVGGSHVSALGLIRLLDPARYRAIVVPEHADGRIAALFEGVERRTDPVWRPRRFIPGEAFGPLKFLGTLSGLWPRIRFLRRERIDIVHVNDGRSSANWALAARLAGVRLLWHHRGDPGALGLRLAAPLLADRVLTVSAFALPRKGSWSAASRAQVVHSPFDTDIAIDREAARARLIQELGISPDTTVIGFFGAFVPRKRPLLFVDAIDILRRSAVGPIVGVMFGEARVPAMEQALRRRIAETETGDHVRLMGYRTPGAEWIAACDQLAVPAIGEPFGRTLVEAMLVGTPIVAARSGGNIEALQGGNGLLVAPDDAAAIAGGCAWLISRPELAAANVAYAREQARHRFGETHHRDQVVAVYDRLIASR